MAEALSVVCFAPPPQAGIPTTGKCHGPWSTAMYGLAY